MTETTIYLDYETLSGMHKYDLPKPLADKVLDWTWRAFELCDKVECVLGEGDLSILQYFISRDSSIKDRDRLYKYLQDAGKSRFGW